METAHDTTVEPDLRRLCGLYGVTVRYTDGLGTERVPPPEALLAVLRALGAPVGDDPGRLSDALRARRLERARRALPPVRVLRPGREPAVVLGHSEERGDRPEELRLELEGGEAREWSVRPGDLTPVGGAEAEGRRWIRRRLPLPGPLPLGRHRLRMGSESAWLLSTPTRAFVPEPVADERGWGVFAPLYALRSDRSRRLGGLAELAELRAWLAELGGDAVATLPLLATFLGEPFEPSPYLPVSRLFWNELFVETEWALEEDLDRMDRSALPEPRVAAVEDASPPAGDLLDYRAAARERRRALEPLARAFFRGAGEDDVDFRRFVEERPRVRSYAAFRAVAEARRQGWPAWPEELRDPDVRRGGELPAQDREAVEYHLYAQWVARRQLRRVRTGGAPEGSDGPGLYLDLPLGAHPDGYDTWSRPGLFAPEVSGGAPPDAFFRQGQDWGFPPVLPARSRAEGHAYLGECLRHSMEACRWLRVDHVMGFQRLFWIPRGMRAVDGVYVRYPAPELLALTCLESHRSGTGVVGEDLGTVPPAVRRAMEERRISRLHVVEFELPPEPHEAPGSVSPGAVASVGTHDTPTFAGFWRGLDLEHRKGRGDLEPVEARDERNERSARLEAYQDWLTREGHLDPGETDPYRILRAVLRHLADSRAGLVMVSLDDLWLEEHRQNVPGEAGGESWRRLHRYTVPEIRGMDAVAEALDEVARIRAARGRKA